MKVNIFNRFQRINPSQPISINDLNLSNYLIFWNNLCYELNLNHKILIIILVLILILILTLSYILYFFILISNIGVLS